VTKEASTCSETFISVRLSIAFIPSKICMSQEPENNNSKPVEKLLIDNASDFRFHAAYLAYSETWDKASSADARAQLNGMIVSLSRGEIDAETFYIQLNQYRRGGGGQDGYGGRLRIETSRKRDWRKREAKSARESRHRR
jgi:hypothetical protein